MISAIVNSWSSLAKQRPSQLQLIISALAGWRPSAISSFPYATVRSVEKAVRLLLIHLSRYVAMCHRKTHR